MVVAGLSMIALGGGLGWGLIPPIVKQMVDDNIDLTNTDSEGYKNFVSPPVPVLMKFTFYHVANPLEIVTGVAKPVFIEKGPYVYREVRKKLNININKPEEFIEYEQYRHFEFAEEESCVHKDGAKCTKDDTIRILNMPLIGAVNSKDTGSLSQMVILSNLAKVIDNSLNSMDLFMEDTVDNILFQGVKSPVVIELLTNSALKGKMPPAIQFKNGFAIFNTKNASTHNEAYRVSTTADRHSMIEMWGPSLAELTTNLSEIRTYPSKENEDDPLNKFDSKLWWPWEDFEGNKADSHCNVIRGTNAEQFPPRLEDRRDDNLWIFTTDLCRSLYFNYLEDQDIDGIKVLRYSVSKDGANINKTRNFCFCKDLSNSKNKDCAKEVNGTDELDLSGCEIENCYDGLIDLSQCMLSSVMMGSPHFYQADAQLEHFDESFQSPVDENDRTYLDIEPTTGMVLRVHKRIQVNMPVIPTGVPTIKFLENIKKIPAFPVVWLDEGAEVDQENIDKIKSMVTTPLLIIDVGKFTLLGLGGISLLLGVSMFFMM